MKDCKFCKRPMPNAGSNRDEMHPGCTKRAASLALWRKDLKAARKLADRVRHRKPVAAMPQKSTQEAGNGPSCEFCARVHDSVAERVACRARAERARADVREVWR